MRENISIEEGQNLLENHYPVQSKQIAAAIDFAKYYHHGQKRKSGEDYIVHPLQVALILDEERASAETVIAAILHDTIEDTAANLQEIKSQFGQTIAFLVDGLSKIERLEDNKHSTYKKLLIAAANDARVLIIKLADRLHNMRTIQALSPDARSRIARETLNVYAPLAHRLGMNTVRSELENRALAILEPAAYETAILLQKEARKSSHENLDTMQQRITKNLKKNNIDLIEVKSRVKNLFSIAEKQKRDPDNNDDILGLRIIVKDINDCYSTLGIVHSLWPPLPGSFDDYIALPKANLYRSLHTAVKSDRQTVEIQIRTGEMDQIAEKGIAAHWLYKEKLRAGGPEATEKFIQKAAENQMESDLSESFQALKDDFFADEIYLFTPQGDIRILPQGATAIDFAYHIHSEIGDRLVGARVNGKLVPITEPLDAGQTVEIITGKKANPSLDWLQDIKTAKARNKIRSFHQEELIKERIEIGKKNLQADIRRMGVKYNWEEIEERLEKIGHSDLEKVFEKVNANPQLGKQIAQQLVSQPQEIDNVQEKTKSTDASVVVDGIEATSVRLAGCCHPEPGDDIIGYVSSGRGVTIHRRSCSNAQKWIDSDSPRLIPSQWSGKVRSFTSKLAVRFKDLPYLLPKIADSIYNNGAEIKSLQMSSSSGIVKGHIDIVVTSREQIESIIESLSETKGALHISKEKK